MFCLSVYGSSSITSPSKSMVYLYLHANVIDIVPIPPQPLSTSRQPSSKHMSSWLLKNQFFTIGIFFYERQIGLWQAEN